MANCKRCEIQMNPVDAMLSVFCPVCIREIARRDVGRVVCSGTVKHFYANEPIGTATLYEGDGLWTIETWDSRTGGRDVEVHLTRESAEQAFATHTTRY